MFRFTIRDVLWLYNARMRFRLRSLLIALGVAPPALAALWFAGPIAWFVVVLCVLTFPALYVWVTEPQTAVGLVFRWVIVLLTLLCLLGLLFPAIQ